MPALEFRDPRKQGVSAEYEEIILELVKSPRKWAMIGKWEKASTAHSIARRFRTNTYTPADLKDKWVVEALAQKISTNGGDPNNDNEETEVFVRVSPKPKPRTTRKR